MKRDEVIALTIEAGFDDIDTWINGEDVPSRQVEAAKRWLERTTELVNLAYQRGVSDERDECALLHDSEDLLAPIGQSVWGEGRQDGWIEATSKYRDAIRSRTTNITP